MKRWVGSFLPLWIGMLTGLLALSVPAGAQGRPDGAAVLLRPANGAANLSGIVRIDVSFSPAPTGTWTWTGSIFMFDVSGNFIGGEALVPLSRTRASFAWNSAWLPDGTYRIKARGRLYTNDGVSPAYEYDSAVVTVTTRNPSYVRHTSRSKLYGVSSIAVTSGSDSLLFLGGSLSFAIPITGNDFVSAALPLMLTSSSMSLVDPQAPPAPDFAGLSEKNSKWSHTYAQWIDLYQDETGTEYAVWHGGGRRLAFQKSGAGFISTSGLSSLQSGGAAASPLFPRNGANVRLTVPYDWFIAVDFSQTEYHFNVAPPAGQRHLVWRTSEGTAIPHYLLTRIRDSSGRTINITWSGGDEPHVTAVTGDANLRLTFGYTPLPTGFGETDSFLTSVTDASGRTHTFGYSQVLDESWLPRQKLTRVTALVSGATNTALTWRFGYRDDANPYQAYGGSPTGDLIIEKTDPNGLTRRFRYDGITLTREGFAHRMLDEDWDGRLIGVY